MYLTVQNTTNLIVARTVDRRSKVSEPILTFNAEQDIFSRFQPHDVSAFDFKTRSESVVSEAPIGYIIEIIKTQTTDTVKNTIIVIILNS